MPREQLLNKLRHQLHVDADDKARLQSVNARISQHPNNTIPARAQQPHSMLVDLCVRQITIVHGTVARIDHLRSVPHAIAEFLEQQDVEICLSPAVSDLGLSFEQEPGLKLVDWSPKTSLAVSVTTCFGAVAETGSLVICSSAQNPLSQSFLADQHIVLLRSADVVGSYEDIWQKVRTLGGMPRDMTLVSGPSCTGDIEMILEYGAHGPKALHVIIIAET
ncbi:MAG: lactate utilization protein [bacterium]|nr:hypothetical protein [Gammaproteobacteria bacterium]HIL95895.1 hypothetical protein [Pseudomonadales bacterium]